MTIPPRLSDSRGYAFRLGGMPVSLGAAPDSLGGKVAAVAGLLDPLAASSGLSTRGLSVCATAAATENLPAVRPPAPAAASRPGRWACRPPVDALCHG